MVPVLFFWQPAQKKYYLDNDIAKLESAYLTPTLIGIFLTTCILIFALTLIKAKSLKESSIASLSVSLHLAFYLLLFQPLFLAGILFINRQFKKDIYQKAYVVSYLVGVEKNKSTFFPYDVSKKRITNDEKVIDQLYKPGLIEKDTVMLYLNKGLLGVAYISKPFPN